MGPPSVSRSPPLTSSFSLLTTSSITSGSGVLTTLMTIDGPCPLGRRLDAHLVFMQSEGQRSNIGAVHSVIKTALLRVVLQLAQEKRKKANN